MLDIREAAIKTFTLFQLLCSEGTLGKEAPSWVHNSQVTMCMLCAASFKGLKRKHHCRSCGMVCITYSVNLIQVP